jgi:hypothetical protein
VDTAALQKEDVDTIWLAEPQRDTAWAGTHGYDCLSILPPEAEERRNGGAESA